MSRKQKRGSFIVRFETTIVKEVVVSDCTEEQANSTNFLDFSDGGETEIECVDIKIKSVTPND